MVREHWSVLVASGIAFLVYLLTLCPTVYVEGSGELIGAVHFLGTPHPSGYPLFCLIGRLFSAFLPFDSVAFEVNLASAFTGAVAVAAMVAFLRGRGCSSWAGLAGGLVLGFSSTFWSQVVVAEVYGLGISMAILVMSAGLRVAERQEVRWLLMTAFLMGLGLTAHLSQVLVWPGLVLLVLWRWPRLWRQRRLLAGAGLALIGGYSLVLYLPLRNGLGPGFHWGVLNTPQLLWDHLSGAIYRGAFFSMPREAMALNAGRWFSLMMGEFNPLLVPAIGWGAWRAWKQDRNGLIAVAAAVLMNLLAALNYHRDPNGIGVFFLLSFAGLAVFIGYAVDDLGKRLGRAGPVLVGALVPMVVLMGNWEEADRSGNRVAYEYGRDILEELPERAVLITEADDASFIIDYLQRVEGMRADVAIFNRLGRGTDLLEEEERTLPLGKQARLRRQREAELIERGERDVFFLIGRHMPAKGFQFLPEGLSYRVAPEGEKARAKKIDMSNAKTGEMFADPWTRKIQSNYWYMLGEQRRVLGQRQEAIEAFEKAAQLAFDSRSMRFNVALMLYRYDELTKAMDHARVARKIDPWQVSPYRLMARIARRQGKLGEADMLLKRAAFLEGSP